jgi:hypothetical protein
MPPERRGHPRRQVGPHALDLLSPLGPLLCHAVAEDVSAGGALLLASRPFEPGEVLTLAPEGPPALLGRRFAFRVTRCEPAEGGYRVAGAFVSPLTQGDLAALAGPEPQGPPAGRARPCPAGVRKPGADHAPEGGGRPPDGKELEVNELPARGGDDEHPGPSAQALPGAPGTDERRGHPRYRAGPGACLFRVVSPAGLELGRAAPEDVSAGGALLLSPHLLPVGEAVVLEVLPSHPLASRRLGFRVLRCVDLADGGHLLAGLFAPRLPDPEAAALAGAGASSACVPAPGW